MPPLRTYASVSSKVPRPPRKIGVSRGTAVTSPSPARSRVRRRRRGVAVPERAGPVAGKIGEGSVRGDRAGLHGDPLVLRRGAPADERHSPAAASAATRFAQAACGSWKNIVPKRLAAMSCGPPRSSTCASATTNVTWSSCAAAARLAARSRSSPRRDRRRARRRQDRPRPRASVWSAPLPQPTSSTRSPAAGRSDGDELVGERLEHPVVALRGFDPLASVVTVPVRALFCVRSRHDVRVRRTGDAGTLVPCPSRDGAAST